MRKYRFYAQLLFFVLMISFAILTISSVVKFLLDNMWIFVVLISLAILILLVVIFVKIIKNIQSRYIKISTEQNPAIRALKDLNLQYKFEHIPDMDLSKNYDNENFYNEIDPIDYLTYRLVDIQKRVCDGINAANKNSFIYPAYSQEVEVLKSQLDNHIHKNILFKNAFKKIQMRVFENYIQAPIIEFKIAVTIYLTKINGVYRCSKKKIFNKEEIEDIIKRLRNKQNDFYLDDMIWQSICRVERGKVTNRLRFSIYARDGRRCQKCGSTRNLEIDHIFPISKGGKSTPDNLQTLCRRCNTLKSNSVTADTISHYVQTHSNAKNICPQCKRGLLVLRNGKRGKFYGCNNYPNCKFTKDL